MLKLPFQLPASFSTENIHMITLTLTKQYLNIQPSNNTDDAVIQLMIDAAVIQAARITDQTNALVKLALLKDIATNYQHRENYLDSENGGLVLSNTTMKLLNQFRKVIVY